MCIQIAMYIGNHYYVCNKDIECNVIYQTSLIQIMRLLTDRK